MTVQGLIATLNREIGFEFNAQGYLHRVELRNTLAEIIPPLLPDWLELNTFEISLKVLGDYGKENPFLFLKMTKDLDVPELDAYEWAEFCLSFKYENVRLSNLKTATKDLFRYEAGYYNDSLSYAAGDIVEFAGHLRRLRSSYSIGGNELKLSTLIGINPSNDVYWRDLTPDEFRALEKY